MRWQQGVTKLEDSDPGAISSAGATLMGNALQLGVGLLHEIIDATVVLTGHLPAPPKIEHNEEHREHEQRNGRVLKKVSLASIDCAGKRVDGMVRDEHVARCCLLPVGRPEHFECLPGDDRRRRGDRTACNQAANSLGVQ